MDDQELENQLFALARTANSPASALSAMIWATARIIVQGEHIESLADVKQKAPFVGECINSAALMAFVTRDRDA